MQLKNGWIRVVRQWQHGALPEKSITLRRRWAHRAVEKARTSHHVTSTRVGARCGNCLDLGRGGSRGPAPPAPRISPTVMCIQNEERHDARRCGPPRSVFRTGTSSGVGLGCGRARCACPGGAGRRASSAGPGGNALKRVRCTPDRRARRGDDVATRRGGRRGRRTGPTDPGRAVRPRRG